MMRVFQDEWGTVETFKHDDEKARYYCDVGITMVKTGMRLYGHGNWSGGWIQTQDDRHHGDRAYYIKTETMGRIIGVESSINANLDTVFHEAWINIEKVTEYNPTVRDYKVLVDYSDHTRLVYNASHEIFGGLLSSSALRRKAYPPPSDQAPIPEASKSEPKLTRVSFNRLTISSRGDGRLATELFEYGFLMVAFLLLGFAVVECGLIGVLNQTRKQKYLLTAFESKTEAVCTSNDMEVDHQRGEKTRSYSYIL